MDIKRLYGYSVQDLATGIVLADSVEEAREKVKAAYKAHVTEFNPDMEMLLELTVLLNLFQLNIGRGMKQEK